MDIIADLGGLANVTASTLLAACVFMILTGRLVPKSHLDALRAEKDAWQSAALASEAARKETETASWKAVHALTSVERFLTSLESPPKDRTGGGGSVEDVPAQSG